MYTVVVLGQMFLAASSVQAHLTFSFCSAVGVLPAPIAESSDIDMVDQSERAPSALTADNVRLAPARHLQLPGYQKAQASQQITMAL